MSTVSSGRDEGYAYIVEDVDYNENRHADVELEKELLLELLPCLVTAKLLVDVVLKVCLDVAPVLEAGIIVILFVQRG